MKCGLRKEDAAKVREEMGEKKGKKESNEKSHKESSLLLCAKKWM